MEGSRVRPEPQKKIRSLTPWRYCPDFRGAVDECLLPELVSENHDKSRRASDKISDMVKLYHDLSPILLWEGTL